MLTRVPNTQPPDDRVFSELAPLNDTPESMRLAKLLEQVEAIDAELFRKLEDATNARENVAILAAFRLGYDVGRDPSTWLFEEREKDS